MLRLTVLAQNMEPTAEHEEFLRRREAKFIWELFGSKEEPKPKRRSRICAVCGTRGPWNLVCDECEVSPEKVECQIQRTGRKSKH